MDAAVLVALRLLIRLQKGRMPSVPAPSMSLVGLGRSDAARLISRPISPTNIIGQRVRPTITERPN